MVEKKRLQERLAQLVSHTPHVRNRSEIVYAEDTSCGNVAEMILVTEDQSDLDEMENEEMDESVQDTLTENKKMVPNLKELYSPSSAADVTGESAKKKPVSPLLFNFVSWMLGYSDDPDESEYVNLDEKFAVKVFLICQDFVYNNSRGKTQTPKSLSLAISIRQISGCSALIDILSGLGHWVSLSTTMSYDAAMAQVNINSSNLIHQKEFVAIEAVNIVYDNIDFEEEIHKQTHVTNGICITSLVNNGFQGF